MAKELIYIPVKGRGKKNLFASESSAGILQENNEWRKLDYLFWDMAKEKELQQIFAKSQMDYEEQKIAEEIKMQGKKEHSSFANGAIDYNYARWTARAVVREQYTPLTMHGQTQEELWGYINFDDERQRNYHVSNPKLNDKSREIVQDEEYMQHVRRNVLPFREVLKAKVEFRKSREKVA